MKPIKYITLLLLTGMICLSSCHKGDDPANLVPQNLKDLYLYRQGSYWTMRDSLTGRLDSFYVTRFDSSIGQYSGGAFEDNFVNISEANVDGINQADSAFYGFHLHGDGASFQYSDYLYKEDMACDCFRITDPKKNYELNGKTYNNGIEYNATFTLYVNQ